MSRELEYKIYEGGSRPRKWLPLAWIIIVYQKIFFGFNKSISHSYTKYYDEFTEQWMISESSKGEHHNMTLSNWLKYNDPIEEYCIDCTREEYKKIMININDRLQTSYSDLNLFGIPFYDLYKYTKFKVFEFIAIVFFDDGQGGVICSESSSYNLEVKGIKFDRPNSFIKPHMIIERLRKLALTEDYIGRVI